MQTWITAFFSGVVVTSVTATLLFAVLQPAQRNHDTQRWQMRAEEAERQLAVMRNEVQTISTQLAAASVRREAASQRNIVPTMAQECPPLPSVPPSSVVAAFDSDQFNSARQTEWQALVAGALQSEVQRRFGRTLPPEKERRLLDTLARLRDASLEMNQKLIDPEDPASLSDQLTRSIVLLEADRVFRDELGIGVSGFLQGLSADQIEEVIPVEPASTWSQ